jgi:hypothetical protein
VIVSKACRVFLEVPVDRDQLIPRYAPMAGMEPSLTLP